MSPAPRSSLRCWETVDWARGRRSTRPPQTQVRRPPRISRMRRRTGWARALASAAVRTSAGSNGSVFAWAMVAPVSLIVYRKYTIKNRFCQAKSSPRAGPVREVSVKPGDPGSEIIRAGLLPDAGKDVNDHEVAVRTVLGDEAEPPAQPDPETASVVRDAAAVQAGPGPGADEGADDGDGRVQSDIERERNGFGHVIEAQAQRDDPRHGEPPEGFDDPDAAVADGAERQVGLPAFDLLGGRGIGPRGRRREARDQDPKGERPDACAIRASHFPPPSAAVGQRRYRILPPTIV